MIFLLVSTLVLATFLFLVFLLNQQIKFTIFVFEFVSSILDLVTLPVYLLIDQPWKIKLRSKTVTSDRHYEPNGKYHYWQANESPKEERLSEENRTLKSSLSKLGHLSELLSIVAKVHRGKKCLGRRKVLGRKIENGKVRFKLSDEFEWKTYDEVLSTIREFAKVLHHKFRLKRGDRVAIFAETSPEFIMAFFSFQLLGCEVVLLRSTPDESTISPILNENEISLVFSQTNFVKLLNKLKPKMPTLSKLICFRHPFGSETDEEEVRKVQYEFFEYEQLLKDAPNYPPLEPKQSMEFSSNDISNIISTSGSSGVPKSVLVKHACWIALLKRLRLLESNNENTFLAYLEGSHAMELLREVRSDCQILFASQPSFFVFLKVINFVSGTKMAFGTHETLLTDSDLLAEGCMGDLKVSEATHIIAHPL